MVARKARERKRVSLTRDTGTVNIPSWTEDASSWRAKQGELQLSQPRLKRESKAGLKRTPTGYTLDTSNIIVTEAPERGPALSNNTIFTFTLTRGNFQEQKITNPYSAIYMLNV